jgi:hypothetical protein
MRYDFPSQRDAGEIVTVSTSDLSAFLNVVLDKPSNGRRSSDMSSDRDDGERSYRQSQSAKQHRAEEVSRHVGGAELRSSKR